MNSSEIVRFDSAASVSRAASERYLEAARDAVRERGRFVVALSGGSTPRAMHRLLTSGPLRLLLPWSRTFVLFGDERCVPPDHEQSNYRMVHETLLDHVRIPVGQVHRMRGEMEDPDAAASEYEQTLRRLFPDEPWPRLDLLMLGIGTDGHTASLFPGTDAISEGRRWVVSNHVPQLDSRRITLSFPSLCAARRIVFLATGEGKAEVLSRALRDPAPSNDLPFTRVIAADGTREFLVDRDAAKLL